MKLARLTRGIRRGTVRRLPKMLARFSSKKAYVFVIQRAFKFHGRFVCQATLHVASIGMRVKHKAVPMNDKHLPLNAMMFRALDALVVDGKLIGSVPYPEWQIQLALGTMKSRHFYLNPDTKAKTR